MVQSQITPGFRNQVTGHQQLGSGLFEITRFLIDCSDKRITVLGPVEDLAGV
jgi:hypothetical protein